MLRKIVTYEKQIFDYNLPVWCHGRSLVILMYGPEGRILNFNTAWCKVVQSQVSILKHANKIYNEHKNIMFLLNTTYTKILIYIEKVKKMFGPGPTGPYGSYAYGCDCIG